MGRFARPLLVVYAAAAFGLIAGLIHGNTGGLRAAIGNVSTPWLLVALIPAWQARSGMRGALAATLGARWGPHWLLATSGHLAAADTGRTETHEDRHHRSDRLARKHDHARGTRSRT